MAGKRTGAIICPPTPCSGESTPSWHPLPIGSSQDTFLVQTTQLTDLPVASIPPPCCFSCRSLYPRTSVILSSTLTIPGAVCSASNINFTHLPTLPASTDWTAIQCYQPIHNNPHSNTLHLPTLILPYPTNLTPIPSDLHLHCTTKDRLGRWLPHSNALALVGLPATCELQERVKAGQTAPAPPTVQVYLYTTFFVIVEESQKRIVPLSIQSWYLPSSQHLQAHYQAKWFIITFTAWEPGTPPMVCPGPYMKNR